MTRKRAARLAIANVPEPISRGRPRPRSRAPEARGGGGRGGVVVAPAPLGIRVAREAVDLDALYAWRRGEGPESENFQDFVCS